MSSRVFRWLGVQTGTNGKTLHTGHHYDVDDYGADTVATWIAQGLAVLVTLGPDTTLEVKDGNLSTDSRLTWVN